jgi:hypothetical protein
MTASMKILFSPPAFALWGNWDSATTPPHIAAHLQAHTSQSSIQRLSKELQFCHRTTILFTIFEFLTTNR